MPPHEDIDHWRLRRIFSNFSLLNKYLHNKNSVFSAIAIFYRYLILMTFAFSVSNNGTQQEFTAEPQTSLYFLGANGGGKTRLAVAIEQQLGDRAHRISAHRALALNPSVPKISEKNALRGLRFGNADDRFDIRQRDNVRWNKNAATSLLNDFDFLIQALFADQSNVALVSYKDRASTQKTKFDKLEEIWSRIMPHRQLNISGDDIEVLASNANTSYGASEMSDGERATFYLLGQTLTAPNDSLIIFDEPELHIHRAIMSRLWDELEALRPDCALVVISHDLEFIASRAGQKFVLSDYSPATGWQIEGVPNDTGFSEEVTTKILGSRTPILFVEGDTSSLDVALYRACFPDWTVLPKGSCQDVIHSVTTMRANPSLNRIHCAGVIDADHKSDEEAERLSLKGVYTLPVCEIENLFLMPTVLEAILDLEGHAGQELETRRDQLLEELFTYASDDQRQKNAVLRFCRREIDSELKRVDLSDANDAGTLADIYTQTTESIDVNKLAAEATANLHDAIASKDAQQLLKLFDDKGLMAIASKAKGTNLNSFKNWIQRSMRNDNAPKLKEAITALLPTIEAA